MPGRTLATALLLLVSVPAAPGVAASDAVRWTRGGGAFHTTEPLGRGDEVRLRIQESGQGHLELVRWHKKKKRTSVLRRWEGGALRRGQVVKAVLPESGKIGLRVGGRKQRPPKDQAAGTGYSTLRFGGGWRIDVKVIDADF